MAKGEDEKFRGKRTVSDETAKVTADNAVPGWAFALIELQSIPCQLNSRHRLRYGSGVR